MVILFVIFEHDYSRQKLLVQVEYTSNFYPLVEWYVEFMQQSCKAVLYKKAKAVFWVD